MELAQTKDMAGGKYLKASGRNESSAQLGTFHESHICNPFLLILNSPRI